MDKIFSLDTMKRVLESNGIVGAAAQEFKMLQLYAAQYGWALHFNHNARSFRAAANGHTEDFALDEDPREISDRTLCFLGRAGHAMA